MTSDPEAPFVETGRPIRLTPVKPGVWWIILGGVIAALGPMFGFLFGTMSDSSAENQGDVSPIFLYLMIGILVGGVGVLLALLGVRRVLRDRAPENDDN